MNLHKYAKIENNLKIYKSYKIFIANIIFGKQLMYNINSYLKYIINILKILKFVGM